MEFRGYEPAALDAMYALDVACFAPQFRFSRRDMRRFAEAKNARVLLAWSGEVLAGFCVMHLENATAGRFGYVVTLDVAEPWRRQGIAAALMEGVEAQALAAACSAMLLHVYEGNAAAIRFYERGGYSRVGEARGFYGVDAEQRGVDALVYRKALASLRS